MNYCIARLSDISQLEAMPAQRKRLLDYATKLTWKEGVDYKLIEINETAFKEGRKKFQDKVIAPLLKEKDLSIVVFDKIDRYSRDSSSEEKAILTKLFRQGKIELHFPSDNLYINKNSPAPDLFRLDIGIALAGYYSSAIRDNIKRRFDQMLADGIWPGKAPIGYTNLRKNEKETTIIADPERGHFITKAFELRATGLPYQSIANQLKEAGLRSNTKYRKPVTASKLEEVINNPFYMGQMRYNGKIYNHNYPPLIDQWLWDKCQEIKNLRSNGRTKYNAKPFLFKQLKCAECGYTISFDGPKTKNGTIYGHCTEYGGKHGAKNVKEAVIVKQVKDLLKAIQIPKKKLPLLIAEIEANQKSEQEYYKNNKARLEAEYDTLDGEIQELFKDRKQFKSRMDVFEKMVKEIESRQKTILQELEDHSNGDKAFILGASYILEVCSRALDIFNDERAKLDQKRYLLNFVVTNLELDGETLRFQYKEPFNAIKDMVESKDWRARPDSNRRSPP
jgi:site-specific DNA recombinase